MLTPHPPPPTPLQTSIAKVPATASFADYGGYSDWASPADLRKCYEVGLKAGTVQAIRQYAASAWRTLLPILPNSGNPKVDCPPGSNLPATVRFIFLYDLKANSPAVCKKGRELNVSSGPGWMVGLGCNCTFHHL